PIVESPWERLRTGTAQEPSEFLARCITTCERGTKRASCASFSGGSYAFVGADVLCRRDHRRRAGFHECRRGGSEHCEGSILHLLGIDARGAGRGRLARKAADLTASRLTAKPACQRDERSYVNSSAWLTATRTVSGTKGFVTKKVGSGRSPVRSRSG